jgi:hypothetical protein
MPYSALLILSAALLLLSVACSDDSGQTGRDTAATARVAPAASEPERETCGDKPAAVVLVIDQEIPNIRPGLDQFEADLCGAGYAVIERRGDFTEAPQLRAYLAEVHARSSGRLAGAMFIGDFPKAYQWVVAKSANPAIPSVEEEVLSLQYYSDLDGLFRASPNYTSRGRHQFSFDVHEGNVDWEIWTAVLPLYRGDSRATAEALNRYFAKNHAYRTGQVVLPRAFLQVSEFYYARTQADHDMFLSGMRSGQYAWTPFSNAPSARLYFNSETAGLWAEQGYEDLSAGVADFTVQDSHGNWSTSGRLDIAWVESRPVRTIFYWSNGCAIGDLDKPNNFLTSILYSSTSTVLIAKGTTNDSGGMGNNRNGFFGHNIATAMTGGDSFGDALVGHVNVPLISPWDASREFHFATSIIVGDPTLRLRP